MNADNQSDTADGYVAHETTAAIPATAIERTFSPADELLLLQLLTRRAMAARTEQQRKSLDDPDGESQPVPMVTEVPPSWRLVPEGFVPHGWQQECLSRWLPLARGTVKVATGGGKTLFAFLAAQELQNTRAPELRVVVVVPTIPLMHQWRDELKGSNLPSSAIGMLGGGETPEDLSQVRVLIAVLNSAREKLPRMVTKAGWSGKLLLIVDECHRAAAEQARKIFDAKPAFTLGLSATPEQDAQEEGFPSDEAYTASDLGQAVGPIIYEFTLKDSLAAGLLTPFEVWHIGLALGQEESVRHAALSREISELRRDLQPRHRASRSKLGFIPWCQNRAREDNDAAQFIGLASERKRLLYRATARTEIALGILQENTSNEDSGRAIVFHESIDEVEKLFLNALTLGLPAVMEHSKLPDSVRSSNIAAFRHGIARIIISAKSLVEGFNVPSADLGVIAASSGSVRQRIQSLGRMLRRKPNGRGAVVLVLYVRDTEDEAIYEKADWEDVVGAERNRYFRWNPDPNAGSWSSGLEELNSPPRIYRPPSFEVDVATLTFADPYPGQTSGEELKLDVSGTLRTRADNRMVKATAEQREGIVSFNRSGYATRTPAGHLIVRTEAQRGSENEWRYLGTVPSPEELPNPDFIRLNVKRASGRTVLGRAGKSGALDYALGPGQSRSPEAGEATTRLIKWLQDKETEFGTSIPHLYWDGASAYWVEVGNSRETFNEPIAPLEFKE